MADDLVLYGTPFPSIENDSKDYVPIWRQKAVLTKGTKRLHGAFEGGFSAGYHGTVGSKEGWKPSEFVSSRDKRIGDLAAQKNAEYFMDEEDLSELSMKKLIFIKDYFINDHISSEIISSNQTKPLPRNSEVSEAFSGGGAWDDPDDTITSYDKLSTLHLIGQFVESKADIIDDQLSLDFGESINLETIIPVNSCVAPSDYIPKKINAFPSGTDSIVSFGESNAKSSIYEASTSYINDVDEKTASSALKGFMPFGEDLEKQQRYTNYLRFCIKGKNNDLTGSNNNFFLDEKEREEFIMSAQIFKPSSAVIASRFQSSSAPLVPNALLLKPGLSRPESKPLKSPDVNSTSIMNSKNYSRSDCNTGRTEYKWTPNSLLCKRFNIEPPKSGPVESMEPRKLKPLLASEEVERIFGSIAKDPRDNLTEDGDYSRNLYETSDNKEILSSIPTDEIFEEIFGSESHSTIPRRPRATDYFD